LASICLLLVTLAFLQSPGQVAADTKLDLAVAPVRFLLRATTLWDSQGFFGQLQNQAYGYLVPMGPFFAAGDLLGLPAWVVQRVWWGVLLCTAFLGVVRLTRLLGDRGAVPVAPLAQVVAGLAYALAPRVITTLGPVSIESLPLVLAPWVLVPLLLVDHGRSARRMAAASGVAVLLMGAVNAVATAAVLPVAVWWLVTRRPFPRRLAAWWALSVGLAVSWWVTPLVLLGRYSPPFLDWIEAAAVTTRPTDPATVLRGTSHWVAYVADSGGAVWPAGWALVTSPALVIGLGALATLGLLGLVRRDLPERPYLVGLVAIGLAMVSFGHVGPVGALNGLGAEWFQGLLDGPLAPLRNVHKADPSLRLALAICVGHLVSVLLAPARRRQPRMLLAVAGIAALVGAVAAPLWSGGITSGRVFDEIPGYWQETADFLAEQGPGRALVVPAASFGTYVWGRTQDEPLQPLAESAWGVRDAVPLSSAGNIRLLDAVDQVLATGQGSPALGDVLARSGIRWLVVRNDLDGRAQAPRPVLVRQALERSRGVAFREDFGPVLPPFRTLDRVADYGLQAAYASVEVWEVTAAPVVTRTVLRTAEQTVRVDGGPEALLPLTEAGVVTDHPVVVSGDPGGERATARVTTDTFRRTEVNFGSVRDNRSATMGATQPFVLDRPVHDYLPIDPGGRQPFASEAGYTVRSSSTTADASSVVVDPAAQPWSALDGDTATAWRPDPGTRSVWWEVVWPEPVDLDGLRIVAAPDAEVEEWPVTVATEDETVDLTLRPGEETRVRALQGTSKVLRIAALGEPQGSFGLAEVSIPGRQHPRPVLLPQSASGSVVMTARPGERAGCVWLPEVVQCSPDLGRAGEERAGIDRVVLLEDDRSYRVDVTVTAKPGPAVTALTAPGAGGLRISASSVNVGDPVAGPAAVVDGDPATSWVAAADDLRPSVEVELGERREIGGILLGSAPELAASRPLQVRISSDAGDREVFLDRQGAATFPPLTTDRVVLQLGLASPLRTIDPGSGRTRPLPVGFSELGLGGAQDLIEAAWARPPLDLPCGEGPDVLVDGVVVARTAVQAAASDVREGRRVEATVCAGPVDLPAGEHRITVASTDSFLVTSVALLGSTAAVGTVELPRTERWTDTEREVVIPSSGKDRILETAENYNPGWRAVSMNGEILSPVRVDGWRQAWLVPAGLDGPVALTFQPQGAFSVGLRVGVVAALILLALALVPARRTHPRGPVVPGQHVRLVQGVLVTAVALTAGWAGLLLGGVAVVVVRRRPGVAAPVITAGMGVSTAIAAGWVWPTTQSLPAAAAAVSAGATVVAVVVACELSRRR
jgi:arabinofuranan 3-O-arabinosyltransferase